ARGEQSHHEFWKRYAPDSEVKVNRRKVYFTLLLRLTLGLTFTMKFLERHEDALHQRYREMLAKIPPGEKVRFEAMMEEEEHQEELLMGEIREGRVKYMSFIVLGLADAVVEISGIHAGSLGIFNRTEFAGLAGVIAGMAASIAMASAAYAQSKQGFEGSAKWSAIYTGVSYMFTAIFLALPYFLTASMITALAASLAVGVVLVAMMTYYDTVISTRKFRRQFAEIAGIIFGATIVLYIAGTLIRDLIPGLVIP
ncbi:MAG TPA: rubrerythrin family protein, partial [Candidatus Bathyarchaeia archaeon]|nr:rubrerythrin family protein [Candidatus Bathyarchaeia archaeon]